MTTTTYRAKATVPATAVSQALVPRLRRPGGALPARGRGPGRDLTPETVAAARQEEGRYADEEERRTDLAALRETFAAHA
ncbi:hypothetical protein [Streptomyces sp. CRN 30]|uniref:hypothetical protein n=1 Tax=Streptomyces sp. CRN 30 TaxID=3075613 RepID=UPI002A82FBB9|nr:hypothetical protein [Streptomyces sp. CRN 30]